MALQDPAVHLAFKSQQVHRASAVVHRDHAFHADHASLGVHGNFGELHAAKKNHVSLAVFRAAHRGGGHGLGLHGTGGLLEGSPTCPSRC